MTHPDTAPHSDTAPRDPADTDPVPRGSDEPTGTPLGDDELDPTQVPVYPVLTIELHDQAPPTLNGRPIPVPAGKSPEQAAIAAAAEQVKQLPGATAVRVVATHPTGDTYRMVVAADERVWELPQTPTRRRPGWLWPLIAAVTAVILGGAAITAVVIAKHHHSPGSGPTAAAPVMGPPVGAGANVPRTPPPGYATQATWSVALDNHTDPLVTDDGTIIAVTEDRRLVRLDPATGNPTWAGAIRSSAADLHLTAIDGTPAVATATTRQLLYWPLPSRTDRPLPADQDPQEPRHLDLPQQADVKWAGSAPLITLPDQTAAVVDHGALTRLDIPIGARAVSADATSVTAIDPAGHWWKLTPGQPAPPAKTLQRAGSSTGDPRRIVTAGPDHLAAVWTIGIYQRLVLYDLAANGRVVAQGLVSGMDLTRAKVVSQTAGPAFTVGPVLIDPTRPAVIVLGGSLAVQAVTQTHVYATRDRGWLDFDITTGKARARGIHTVDDPAIPTGLIRQPDLALVVEQKVEHRLLYALPRSP